MLLISHTFPPILGVRDYCLEEGFSANCDGESVIMIKTALYGRMNVGRCVTRNYGYIGCSQDVYSQVSKLCSGKRTCKIGNFASTFSDIRPCPEDLKGYMEVSYECVSGKFQSYRPPVLGID